MSAERRRAPRFNRLLWITIAGVEARTANVSATGLQLALDTGWWQRLECRLVDDRFSARIGLPGGLTVSAECRVVYVSECDGECLVGVRIVGMGEDDERLWSEFVSAAVPVAVPPAAAFAAP